MKQRGPKPTHDFSKVGSSFWKKIETEKPQSVRRMAYSYAKRKGIKFVTVAEENILWLMRK